MFGSELESAIQLLHHATKAHDGSEVQLAVDPHQLSKIAEEGKMGAGRLIIDRDGLLADSLPFFKMCEADSPLLRDAAEVALLHRLSNQILNRLRVGNAGPSAGEDEKHNEKKSSGHDLISR